jgi:dolichyl-diphosphooligosaccharide--protein glycosyltransferase
MAPWLQRVLTILEVLLVLLVAVVGLDLRFNDLEVWQQRKELYFLDGRPFFTTYDGFLFARQARELREGLYHWREVDPLRFVPDNFLEGKLLYPFPPLLSVFFAKASALTGWPVENLSLYLIPLLSVLCVIPLVLYLREIRVFAPALLAGFVTLTSLIYLIRTCLARLDTDALNLFFPFAALFLLTRFLRTGKQRWAILASLCLVLYGWWYPAASFLVAGVLIIFTFLLWRKRGGLGRAEAWTLALLFLPQTCYLWQAPFRLYSYGKRLLLGAGTTEQIFAPWPNVLLSISELKAAVTLKKAAFFVLAHPHLFLAGLVGFGGLLLWERRYLLLSLPYFLVGLLIFKSGNRFGFYLAPFVGMGLGFWVLLVLHGLKRLRLPYLSPEALRGLEILLALGLLLVVWSVQRTSQDFIASPKLLRPIGRNLAILKELTPGQAWIWSWWDYGYAISYLGQRAVYLDGGTQTTPKTYYVALSWSLPSQEEGRNVTAFITAYGLKGVKDLLEQGLSPEEITQGIRQGRFLKRWPKQPVFWLFTGDLLSKYAWIGSFGSWDFTARRGRFGVLWQLSGCRWQGSVLPCRRAQINLEKGFVRWANGRIVPLKEIVRLGRDGALRVDTYQPKGLILESVSSAYGVVFILVDKRTFASNFNQMFVLRNYDPRLFELVRDDFPHAVLYRVKWPSS